MEPYSKLKVETLKECVAQEFYVESSAINGMVDVISLMKDRGPWDFEMIMKDNTFTISFEHTTNYMRGRCRSNAVQNDAFKATLVSALRALDEEKAWHQEQRL